MDADRSNPCPSHIRSAWEAFRLATFLPLVREESMSLWVWASPHQFDFGVAAMHLNGVQLDRLDIGHDALAISVFGAVHLVPLAHLAEATVAAMQPAVEFDLRARRVELIDSQRRAIQHLEQSVRERFAFTATPPSSHGLQIH